MNPLFESASSTTRRRSLLAWLLGSALYSRAAGAAPVRPLTESGFEGPYRPLPGTNWGGAQLLAGGATPSGGKPVRLAGCVTDTAGRPLAGLTVQLWQANASGRYNHPGETPGHGQPDPGFRGYGQALTDTSGCFAFQTIEPGGYRRTLWGFVPWRFVPHMHLAIQTQGRDLLVTQIDVQALLAAAATQPDEPAVSTAAARLAGPGGGALLRFDVVLPRA